MNCTETRGSLEMYIAGDLPEGESLDVAAHLAQCDACTGEYDRTRALIGGLRELAEVFVPAERFVPQHTPVRQGNGWVWRLATAAAALVAVAAVTVVAVPAIARQLPLPVAAELDSLEERNAALERQVDELEVRLESIGGEQVPVVDSTPGDLPPEVNAAVQQLAMDFVRAQYAGDLDALAAMGTDRLRADLAARPDDYLRPSGAVVVFAQMTEAAVTEDGTYLVFVRLSDSAEWNDSQYEEDFEIRLIDGEYQVDFMGMDA